MRLFIAINLPKEIKEKIEKELTSQISQVDFKKVRSENLHMTLCFIGDTNDNGKEKIIYKLKQLRAQKIEIEMGKVGEFSGRVVWVGLTKGARELAELSRKVCTTIGYEGEKFSAHITLARARDETGEKTKELTEQLAKANFSCSFTAQKVSLMRSEMLSEGPLYSELLAVELGDADRAEK